MDYSRILEELNKASLFDLYRLRAAISQQLEDPRRLREIKKRLKVGQIISYFDDKENRQIKAKIINLRRTRLLVEHIDDRRRWDIPFYFVNIDAVDTDIRTSSHKEGIEKSQLKVGDEVGFLDRENNELYGEVIKLNQKTASLLVNKRARWRVPYRLLFPVINGEKATDMHYIEGEIAD